MWTVLWALLALVRDAFRARRTLVSENAFLRQQLVVLRRQVRRARPLPPDRAILGVLARLFDWRGALWIVKPETLVRWHRDAWRLLWRKRSVRRGRAGLAAEIRGLIERMAAENPRWGAKRIVGELAKLTIRVHKRTVQKVLRRVRPRRPGRGQGWRTFVRNHLHETWACDFFTVTTRTFRQLYVFFVIELHSRRVRHWAITEQPTRAWTTQQIREATSWGTGPRFLVRDRDDKFGPEFDRAIESCGGTIVRTPPRTPVANAFAERFVGTVRRECLDHMIVWNARHLQWLLKEFIDGHYNRARPHQGIAQQIPAEVDEPLARPMEGRVVGRSVLNGLVHEYSRAA